MSGDSRGILRGQCEACNCGAYAAGDRGLKCVNCGHPPGKHVNLSASSAATRSQTLPASQMHTTDHNTASSFSPHLAANQFYLIMSPPPIPVPQSTSQTFFPMARVPSPLLLPNMTVPVDMQCLTPGCTRPRRMMDDGSGYYDYCGRTCRDKALQTQPLVPVDMQCKTRGCTKPRRQKDDGNGYYDYCGRTCRNIALKQESTGLLSESETCSLPGCTRRKYVDPANNRAHDFCGRSHAFEAQKQGIVVNNVSIREASSQEFTEVSKKFQRAWARGKGPCPSLDFIFIVSNRQLEQRWRAYQQKLSHQTVEEHFHGTKLKCNITAKKTTCNDEDCGICGISRIGMDRRCIQKNINFQRFGHGFYVAPNSSKCHDYTQGAHSYRAMFLCDVCPGRKYIKKRDDENLQSPPRGFDSVHGQSGSGSVLNYDEVVIYNPDSILPRYILVYQKDGTRKIAK